MVLDEIERVLLLEHGELRRYRRDSLLFERGAEGHALFLIVEGEVEIFVGDGAGRTLIGRKRAGEVFGELALLADRPRTASARTTSNSLLAVVSRASFLACHAANPPLQDAIRRHLVATVEQTTLRLATVHLSAYGRLRTCLYDHAEVDGTLPGVWTQQSLAAWSGCTRETVAKILGDLRRGGWIRNDRGRIAILRQLPLSF